MVTRSHCPDCGCELPADSPAGLCPDCLLKAGLGSRASDPAASAGGPFAQTTPQPGGLVPPEPAALAPHFPQLEILELLGHGGMGAVYKARQTKLDRMVALKIVRPESAEDAAFTERFNREARTLARLNHPNIVAVHDFGEVTVASPGGAEKSRTLYYFLMEYVDGANLRRLIDAHGLTPPQALDIVPKICDALQFAHDEGIVHRDIKPENILIDSKGRVKIADFGLAKLAGRSAEEFTLTGTHQVMGTPRYMAPEQMEGSHAVDHRADIYSLGVVFYEMLTGQVPAGHFDPPSKKVQIDVRLDEVVLRSLAREPARRYQQASQVKTDVEVISGSGVQSAARAAAGLAVPTGGALASRAQRSTLGRAWDAWWGERDRWFTTVVQSALLIAFFACMICYLSFNFSSQAGPEFNGRKVRHTTVTYGFPTPWFHLETFPEPTTPWRSNFNLFSSSAGLMLLGFIAYGTYWQIEKAKPNANLHWSSSPKAMFIAWTGLTVFAVLWGLHPIVLDVVEDRKTADAVPSPGKDHVGVPAAAQEFFQAVANGQIESVAKLLANQSKSSALVNAKDDQGRTPLMAAAMAGDPRMAAFLMIRGADEAVRDVEGRSALMLAVEAGQPKVVQMLVDMRKAAWDEDIQFRLRRIDRETTKDLDFSSLRFEGGEEWQDDNGETALMKAAARGDAETYEALGSWSEKMARDKQGRTALVHAIEKRQIEFLKPLFDTADNYVKAREPGHGFVGSVFPELLSLADGAGRTPLQLADATIAARIRSYLEAVIDSSTRRIAAGARSIGFEFRTRGQAHAGLGQTEEARADFREADRLEGPAASPSLLRAAALLEACRTGDVGQVKEHLDAGAGINDKSADGRTTLMNAVAGGHRSLAMTLLLLGGNPTEMDERGMTALLIAVENRDGVFLNRLRDLSQITARFAGAERKAELRAFSGVERSLLEGRDVDLRNLDFNELILQADENGETASLKAARQGDWDIVGQVSNHLDSLKARDKAGRTLTMYAAIDGHRDWLDALSRGEQCFGVAGVVNVFVGGWVTLDVDQLALRDKSGKTALQLAEEHDHKEIAGILREHLEAIVRNQTELIEKGGDDVEKHVRLRDLARQALGDGTKAADNTE